MDDGWSNGGVVMARSRRSSGTAREVKLLGRLEALVAPLESLVGEHGAALRGSEVPTVLGRRVDASDQFYTVLSRDDVLYAFVWYGRARGLIRAAWASALALAPNRVYIRTAKAIFATDARSLAELGRRLASPNIFPVHQSILLHLRRGTKVDPSFSLVAVPVAEGAVELLTVSRRARRRLRAAARSMRIPRRTGRIRRQWAGSRASAPASQPVMSE